ncbi:inner membrane transporter RhtA [Microlunatus sagamiharensis]|uniref:Inner membrane transporter RhtA n=1 Tax=Microlunatus sagamiharensis TaxID=546874 RepID=A0A1H2MC63_9ACTN|nr:EamA family transporter [Microlunatus sagamiharensis]SDU90625.1 inner membrane transporter RhtA [Microlunatus sagamiharensis]
MTAQAEPLTALSPTTSTPATTVPGAPHPGDRPRLLPGILSMSASATGSQIGAAVGTFAYPTLGVPGVVAVRQLVAAAVLLPLARPPFRRFTWAQWWPCLLLAAVFASMNLSLYTAFSRIDLGLAVTLEFLGPLSVALATSRRLVDLVCAVAAAGGVYVLVLPGPSTDWFGVGLALLAGVCWASYILLNRLAGRRLPGLQATATATTFSALGYLPVVVVLLVRGELVGLPLLCAVAVGLLCSALPYAADLFSLRRVPVQLFGVFMSANPVLAALVGLVLLGQVIALHAWVGIGLVVVADVVALAVAARRHRRAAVRPIVETP